MRQNLFVRGHYINETEGHTVHVEDAAELQGVTTMTELFWHIRKTEKGRISKMYIDDKDGKTHHVGYIVTRRKKYDDVNETYLECLWISALTPVKVMREVTELVPFKAAA